MPSHYDLLGVAKDASTEEIKAAFRKLSLKCHPDVSDSKDNGARFKEISNAADVLSNPIKRRQYDTRLNSIGPFGGAFHRQANASDGFKRGASSSQSWFYRVYRPRNLILGPMLFFGTVSALQYMLGTDEKSSLKKKPSLVQAWKNPKTGNWEQPAPWDPLYKQLKPTLEFVPRNEVKSRSIKR